MPAAKGSARTPLGPINKIYFIATLAGSPGLCVTAPEAAVPSNQVAHYVAVQSPAHSHDTLQLKPDPLCCRQGPAPAGPQTQPSVGKDDLRDTGQLQHGRTH